MANTIFTQRATCLGLGTFITRYKASKGNHHHTYLVRSNSKIKYNDFFTTHQSRSSPMMNMVVYANTPLPIHPSHAQWKVWILGTIVTIVLTFSRGKWGPLLHLKDKIRTTIEGAERIADIVEKVAERVDKVAEEASKNLPDGKLEDATEFIEKLAEDIDKRAENVQHALNKKLKYCLKHHKQSTTHHST